MMLDGGGAREREKAEREIPLRPDRKRAAGAVRGGRSAELGGGIITCDFRLEYAVLYL